jgi:hypothetical protein
VGRVWGRQPPTWNQSCQGVARPRHLPRGLLRGRAAFTEGERCTGGLLGCGALVVVGFFGASTIGLAMSRCLLVAEQGNVYPLFVA